eukprot:4651571-Amphidinium_carterae.1
MRTNRATLQLQQLVDADFTPYYSRNNMDHLKVLTTLANPATIQRDRFIPTAAVNDTNDYLWLHG